MKLSDFDYVLPAGQIAQRPLEDRAASRMLLVDRAAASDEDRKFRDFPSLLRGDELIVVNNARVIPARLLGRRVKRLENVGDSDERLAGTGEIEVLLSRQMDTNAWEALVRPGRKMHVGQRVQFGGGDLEAEVVGRGEHGQRTLRFTALVNGTVTEQLERLGHVPLPPYIERADESADRERYQTIFARRSGAIAAPTAGLHFTAEILERIRARGAEICELTLHVGLGTFQPIRGETLEDHIMHGEAYEISPETCKRIARARREGRRVVAIGTTTVRALEDAALRARAGGDGIVASGKAEAHLFITPGFRFQVVDALLTNFHLPRSTLLALVCAFAGRERILAAYRHAVAAGYRFYSYGDCMLIK
ncbi:MAG: tRNA preQ1(34) S-adenosylmethionine ribosyltransferase-isomerase QueA [Candidatus Acidiferrum sp.]